MYEFTQIELLRLKLLAYLDRQIRCTGIHVVPLFMLQQCELTRMVSYMNFLVIYFAGCPVKSPVMAPVQFNICAGMAYMFCIDIHSGRIFSLFEMVVRRVCPLSAS